MAVVLCFSCSKEEPLPQCLDDYLTADQVLVADKCIALFNSYIDELPNYSTREEKLIGYLEYVERYYGRDMWLEQVMDSTYSMNLLKEYESSGLRELVYMSYDEYLNKYNLYVEQLPNDSMATYNENGEILDIEDARDYRYKRAERYFDKDGLYCKMNSHCLQKYPFMDEYFDGYCEDRKWSIAVLAMIYSGQIHEGEFQDNRMNKFIMFTEFFEQNLSRAIYDNGWVNAPYE